VATVGLAARIGPREIARGLLRRRLDLPEFRACGDRRASYLGHYRKAHATTPLAAGRGLGTEEVSR
jgi:hypothetical protein